MANSVDSAAGSDAAGVDSVTGGMYGGTWKGVPAENADESNRGSMSVAAVYDNACAEEAS